MKTIRLKEHKEKALLRRHPWVFSGAIGKKDPAIEDGEIVSVRKADGTRLGCGYYNGRTQIAVRMLSFGEEEFTDNYLFELVRAAVARRAGNPLLHDTDSCRLIFSEGDFLPGLIVDSYGGHLVLQCLTLGMDRLKDTIAKIILEEIKPASIYERSDHEGRGLEGLGPSSGQLYGETPEELLIKENNMSLLVDVRAGQKTGFFLDQRDNRSLARTLARGRKVLNLFSYTGGFSVAAALGGAASVTSVDSSAEALDLARKNMEQNRAGVPAEFIKADIFQYLRDVRPDADLIILDPPALAKNRGSVDRACRGYKDLHLQLALRCPPGATILTCSCSRFIDMNLFQMVVFEAFADAGRKASIIGKHGHPCDHPVSLFCPETEYLKSMLLRLD
ncbi:MAG: class I SAM-dependent rRNA methyltransferase [Spirochaetes bacterium]|nr:class I SAM-dependent rRNA methyltransferase [Spirochaetota bacterium]